MSANAGPNWAWLKASATKSRSQEINQLKAVLVAADPALREGADRPE
ncbi:hypothetical protein ABT009_40455 [Streptomyces sp. NPDC002896]